MADGMVSLFSPPTPEMLQWMEANRQRRAFAVLEEKILQADKRKFGSVKVPVDTLRWLMSLA
jgi:hypothetical protein